MSDLNLIQKNSIRKTAIASAVAFALGSISSVDTVLADVIDVDFDGWFTMLNPAGTAALANGDAAGQAYYGWRTAVTGTMTFDTDTGAGGGTMQPFSFFGSGNASATAITFQAVGDGAGSAGPLILGNMGFNWGGTFGIPTSIVLDASGFFGAMQNGLSTSDTISGVGALPATDDQLFGAKLSYTLPIGPVPIATTTWNTTDIGTITIGVNPSGTLPLVDDGIGGSPMKAGPFPLFNANFDMTDLLITDTVDNTPPVITLVGDQTVNLDVGDTYNEQGATCQDPVSPANPGGENVDANVVIGGDTIPDPITAGTFTVTYNCDDNAPSPNSATQVDRTVIATTAGTPVISLLGNNPETIEAATVPYVDDGATCDDGAGGDIPLPTDNPPEFFDVTSAPVDDNTPGSYPVTYECTNSSNVSAPTVTRDVNVVDTTPPVITLDPDCTGGITHVADGTDPSPTATAVDSVDGDVPVDTTGDTVDPDPDFGSDLSELYNLAYSATDAADNSAGETCQITQGNPDPVATLVGNATVVVGSGADYVEEGATCEDFTDGALPDATPLADTPNGMIDGTTPEGTWTVTYTCGPNSLGNTGTTTREVIVGVAFSAASDSGSTFVMINPSDSFVGGADDVFFSWDGSLYTDPATQTAANMFMGSAEPQPFFGFPWFAHDIRAFGPGDYVIPTSRGNTLELHIEPNQIGAHMLFDWNENNDIDVVLTWDINGFFVGSGGAGNDLGAKDQPFSLAVIDADGDGIMGTPMADGPFTGFNACFNIQMTPLFALPDATATAAQGANDPITVISSAGGTVTVSTTVNPDVNGVFSYGQTGFSYDWSMSDAALLAANTNGTSNDTFDFDPAGLAEGAASALVKVIDNTTGVTSTVVVPLQVTAGLADGDADADGIPDSQDANDNTVNPTLQQAESGNGASFLMESSAGTLIIGDSASTVGVQSSTYQAAIADTDIPVPDDFVENSCVGGCFSYKITGLTKGSTVDVVLPLSLGLPGDFRIRKLMNGTWRDFDTSGSDAIMYAAGSAGDCPGLNDAGWSDTPTAGDFCVKLSTTDGGTNDGDSNANGTVVDPVGVGGGQGAGGQPDEPPKNVRSPSTGGCSLADAGVTVGKRTDWWLLAGVLVALGITRRRRQKLH